MPTFDARTGERTDKVEIAVGVDLARIEVTNMAVTFYDTGGRLVVLVEKPSRGPGAGLSVEISDDIKTTEGGTGGS